MTDIWAIQENQKLLPNNIIVEDCGSDGGLRVDRQTERIHLFDQILQYIQCIQCLKQLGNMVHVMADNQGCHTKDIVWS